MVFAILHGLFLLVLAASNTSARLPVYSLLIAAFIPDARYAGGWINLQGLILLPTVRFHGRRDAARDGDLRLADGRLDLYDRTRLPRCAVRVSIRHLVANRLNICSPASRLLRCHRHATAAP